jgi:DNA-binding PadR family transcriptional regulator
VARVRTEELLLGEWACLGLLAATSAHGFALARRLAPTGDVGRVWSLSRPLTYRSLEQLEARGFIRVAGQEPGRAGGPRTIFAPTPRGRAALRRWLKTPVDHLRDVRAELLLKLVLCDINIIDRGPLLRAQRASFEPTAAALARERRRGEDGDDPVAAWRYESSRAVLRFLDRLIDRPFHTGSA